YCEKGRSTQGGWYYTSCAIGHDSDTASVTLCCIQGLEAARFAGIPVPRELIEKALRRLRDQTKGRPIGGLARGAVTDDSPGAKAGAIACAFAVGDYQSEHVKGWLKDCERAVPIRFGGGRFVFDSYVHFYYAQVIYALGDKVHESLRPDAE